MLSFKKTGLIKGFTLIEIMIVIAIGALVLAVGVPSIFRAAEQNSLRAVANGIVEACSMARERRAILKGQVQELVIRRLMGRFLHRVRAIQLIIRQVCFQIEILGVNFVNSRLRKKQKLSIIQTARAMNSLLY
jgi:prepilin-type N-terminal cleavage/methylation domain-containing protein